jgi:hypothetical protein
MLQLGCIMANIQHHDNRSNRFPLNMIYLRRPWTCVILNHKTYCCWHWYHRIYIIHWDTLTATTNCYSDFPACNAIIGLHVTDLGNYTNYTNHRIHYQRWRIVPFKRIQHSNTIANCGSYINVTNFSAVKYSLVQMFIQKPTRRK